MQVDQQIKNGKKHILLVHQASYNFGKKARYQLGSAQRIKSAIDREKYHDDIMAAHENDDLMFSKQIESEKATMSRS